MLTAILVPAPQALLIVLCWEGVSINSEIRKVYWEVLCTSKLLFRHAVKFAICGHTPTMGKSAPQSKVTLGGYTACIIPLVRYVNGNGNGTPYNGIPYNGNKNGIPFNGIPFNGILFNGIPSKFLTTAARLHLH